MVRVAGTRPARGREPRSSAGVIGDAGEMPELLVVGRVGRPQGIKGEVTVEVRTDDPAERFAVGAVLLTDPTGRGPLVVAAAREQNRRLVLSFQGVADRNAAETLRDTLLQVDAAEVPPPSEPDVFHDHALRGLAAELLDGVPLGSVVDVLHLPHGDVLVVERSDTSGELLVPFIQAMVPVVDVAGSRVVLDPPPGLLELRTPAATAPAPPDEEPAGA